ncbi:MAG: uroporphyrinogen decarboxylase family protein [Actinomycetota bacterium]
MDSLTRVQAALSLELPDRPPVSWWGHTFQEEWSPGELATVTVARARGYGLDLVKLQPRATCFAEAFGSRYRPSGDPMKPPEAIHPAVRVLEDWSWLPKVDGATVPLSHQVETLAQVVAALGPSVPVIQTVFSPITVAGYLLGQAKSRVVREVRKFPALLRGALERIAEALVDFAARSVAAGAAGIFFAVSGYASDVMMTRGEYEELVTPHDRRVLESLPETAWCNILHLCGPRIHFELARELPARAVSWSVHEPGNPSLQEGRDRAGKAVMGGLSQDQSLVHGPPEAVIEEGREAIRATGGRGLIIAPGCSVPPEAPEANLRAISEIVGT